MADHSLQQGLAGIHGYPSKPLNRISHSHDGSTNNTMTNFGRQMRRTAWKYDHYHYGDPGGGFGGIEFGSQKGDESGVTSPPLWKTSPSASPPTETTPLQSHPFNHHHYRLLSPDSRAQVILRGRQELMEMVKQMPESSYELSLKDLVELPKVEQTGFAAQRELTNGAIIQTERTRKKNKKKSEKGGKMSRSGSLNNNGPFLLKMFFPISLRWKNNSSTTGTCSKVSPRPILEGEKGEKDWWKKRFSVSGENGSSRSGSSGGSSSGGSSGGSRNSSRGRNMGACVPACWPFICAKKK